MPFRTKAQRGITPQGRGRFPGFDVLDQAHRWDDVTAGVVLARLTLPKMLSFFTPHEVGVAAPMLDLLMDQDSEPRIPVLALIDGRLSIGETDGWHYDDLPEDGQAWRDTLAAPRRGRTRTPRRRLRRIEHRSAGTAPAGRGRSRGRWRVLARVHRQRRLEPVDAIRLHRVLLTSLGVERDRLPWPGIPAWLPQRRNQRPREVGGRRPRRRRPGPVRPAGGAVP